MQNCIWHYLLLIHVDGESETGPTATSWHGFKFIDPAVSGAVLPILHLNGYKISGPTLYGCMRYVVPNMHDHDVTLMAAIG